MYPLNLGYFISVRQIAYDKGFASLESDRAILMALRDVQLAAVHNTRISAVFLMLMSALFLGAAYKSAQWKEAAALGDGLAEESS